MLNFTTRELVNGFPASYMSNKVFLQASIEAYDRLRHQGLQDGVMDIVLAWDVNETAPGHRSALFL
jgi:hypothetical protein